LRRLVILASLVWPAMSKRRLSLLPSGPLLARPSSTLMALASGVQRVGMKRRTKTHKDTDNFVTQGDAKHPN
jgi:hypothetical protein